jgi:hypothetical protein
VSVPILGETGAAPNSTNRSIDIDPPGLNTPSIPSHPESSSTILRSGNSHSTQGLGRSATEKSLGDTQYAAKSSSDLSPSKNSFDGKDYARGSRDTAWAHRGNDSSHDDLKRYDSDRSSVNGRSRSDSRYSIGDSRSSQRYSRDTEREKDRDRELDRDRDREREWERNRERDQDRRGTDFNNRYTRDDHRDGRFKHNDARRPAPEDRLYDARTDTGRVGGPPRHWDSKASETSSSPPFRPQDDRLAPPMDSPAHRSLAEERSYNPRVQRSVAEDRPGDRTSRPLGDERPFESRLSRPLGEVRPYNGRPDDRDTRNRQSRPLADDHPLMAPLSDGQLSKPISADERRDVPPVDRSVRSDQERQPPPAVDTDKLIKHEDANVGIPVREQPARPSISLGMHHTSPESPYSRPAPPPSTSAIDRTVRLGSDSKQLDPSPTNADRARPVDDRRPVVPPHTDHSARPGEGKIPGDYSRPLTTTTPASGDASTSVRPAAVDRSSRPADDRSHPPAVDSRPARPPSLQERLSAKSADQSPAARAPTSTSIPGSATAGAPANSSVGATRSTDAGPPTRAVPPPFSRPEERSRPPVNDRLVRAASPRGRSPGPPDSGTSGRYNYTRNRPLSLARDDGPPRNYKPRGDTTSPRRGEYRPGDRPSYPDRYERDRSRDRRPDPVDIDSPRFSDRPSASYRRSPPPYGRDRHWGDYPMEPDRRQPSDGPPLPGAYGRDWRDEDRVGPGPSYDEWDHSRRDWERGPPPLDRDRDYERDREPRYGDREPLPPLGWETREERDRRVSGTLPPSSSSLPPVDVPPRPFESRPLSARLSDAYPPDDRDRDRSYDRPRYPPIDSSPPGGYSRIRPRSPSPARRPGVPADDVRPPLKRPRDNGYGPPGYYSPPSSSLDNGRDYPPSRMRTPPLGPPGGYYDDVRDYPPRGISPAGSMRDRDRDFGDGYPPYDRRDPPSLNRIPPPRSPPPYPRPVYGRDDRRYPRP